MARHFDIKRRTKHPEPPKEEPPKKKKREPKNQLIWALVIIFVLIILLLTLAEIQGKSDSTNTAESSSFQLFNNDGTSSLYNQEPVKIRVIANKTETLDKSLDTLLEKNFQIESIQYKEVTSSIIYYKNDFKKEAQNAQVILASYKPQLMPLSENENGAFELEIYLAN